MRFSSSSPQRKDPRTGIAFVSKSIAIAPIVTSPLARTTPT